MAKYVSSFVTRGSVRAATNTPGGPVRLYVDKIKDTALKIAVANAPVNNPLDAQHRGGEVGTYKRSFRTDRRGSRGSFVVGRLENRAGHAIFVELGRSASRKRQSFSWTVWGGDIRDATYTGPRAGKHIVRRSMLAAEDIVTRSLRPVRGSLIQRPGRRR